MNKKNVLISVLGIMLLATFAIAQIMPRFAPPVDSNGEQLNPGYYGRSYKTLSNSTTETVVCTGKCIVHGIVLSSGAATNYLIVKDSTTADGSGTTFMTIPFPGANLNSNILTVPFKTTIGLTIDAAAADGYTATVFYDLQ